MHKEYHLNGNPIPDGYRIYEERLDVAGVQHRQGDARTFCLANGKTLSFEREHGNTFDPNAIKIIGEYSGFFGGKAKTIGYVPAEISAKLVSLSLAAFVKPRLLKTYVGNDGFVEVEFQIIGPTTRYQEYNPPKITPEKKAKEMLEEGNIDDAIEELTKSISNEEAMNASYGVAARPYKALADIYKKQKMLEDEYLILERFILQRRANGVQQKKLAERFLKARIARDKRIAIR